MLEKFNQITDIVKFNAAKTGLGLAYSKLAIQAHGGSIVTEEVVSNSNDICSTLPWAAQQDLITD